MINVKNISKIYKLYANPKDRLKEVLHPFRKKYHTDFQALKEVSFKVKKGETIGIIGKNGAGKSTLLKILTGVLTPTSGKYTISGKVASLLELGAGFNPELSGMENIYLNGSILGYSRKEIKRKFSTILDFADIGKFINQPVKTYSSGMYVRLAFAIAINTDPEILIIDEALSVGDMRFQLKCFRELEKIKKKGTTICFVTHDMGTVINHCDHAIWLHDGQIKKQGLPHDICKKYTSFMSYNTEIITDPKINSVDINSYPFMEKVPWESTTGCESFGEGGAKITHISFHDTKTKKRLKILKGNENTRLSLKLNITEKIEKPIIGFYFTDSQGNNILGTNTFFQKMEIPSIFPNTHFEISFTFSFPAIHNDHYSLSVAIADGTQENHVQKHWIHDVYIIQVLNNSLESIHGSRLIFSDINIDYRHLICPN